jgi:hypothetical protein
MKRYILLLTTLLNTTLILAMDANTTASKEMIVKQEGVKYIKLLGETLKNELQTHMKADKTGLSAMGFCTAKADEITKEINKKLPEYASVRRTALKTRNENNLPDTLDIKVMKDYEASIAANTFMPTDIKVVQEGTTTRVYKPLVTQSVCLKCHGSNISKEIQGEITSNYPKDEAVGFKEGSLRGMIVSEINTVTAE